MFVVYLQGVGCGMFFQVMYLYVGRFGNYLYYYYCYVYVVFCLVLFSHLCFFVCLLVCLRVEFY